MPSITRRLARSLALLALLAALLACTGPYLAAGVSNDAILEDARQVLDYSPADYLQAQQTPNP